MREQIGFRIAKQIQMQGCRLKNSNSFKFNFLKIFMSRHNFNVDEVDRA